MDCLQRHFLAGISGALPEPVAPQLYLLAAALLQSPLLLPAPPAPQSLHPAQALPTSTQSLPSATAFPLRTVSETSLSQNSDRATDHIYYSPTLLVAGTEGGGRDGDCLAHVETIPVRSSRTVLLHQCKWGCQCDGSLLLLPILPSAALSVPTTEICPAFAGVRVLALRRDPQLRWQSTGRGEAGHLDARQVHAAHPN
jgi:hypothetical protein